MPYMGRYTAPVRPRDQTKLITIPHRRPAPAPANPGEPPGYTSGSPPSNTVGIAGYPRDSCSA